MLSSISFLTLLPYFDNFENNLGDKRFRAKYCTTDRKNSIKDIVVIDIDPRTIKELGKYHSWSRARDYWAQAIEVLNKKNTAVLGFDILLDKSLNPSDDTLITRQLKNSNFVVLGYNFSPPDPENFLYADSIPDSTLKLNIEAIPNTSFKAIDNSVMDIGSDTLHRIAAGSGFVNMEPDQDGTVRKVQLFYRYFNKLYPSFAFEICLKKMDVKNKDIVLNNGENIILKNALIDSIRKDITIPLNKNNELLIHFQGPSYTFRQVSFYDVIAKRTGKKTFKNNIALIGTSLRGLMDLRSTPVQENFPGVEIHASIINTILKQNFIINSEKPYTAFMMLFSIIFISLFFLGRIQTTYSAIAVIAYSSAYLWLTFYIFDNHSILLDQFHVLAAMLTTSLFAYLIKYFIENKDKNLIKNTLGKYVPEVVSEAMLKNSALLKLGGERKEISMFFSDIRNFTKISEKVSPEILVKFLNIYLSRMTKIIKNNQGTLDKFMGDAIICFFGAPLENNHPYFACKTALEIIDELNKMRPTMIDDAFKNVQIGIGINTGEVTVGNIGSMELFDYTAIGDNMNLASRLEGLNKYYGTTILISDSTYQKTKDNFIAREIDSVNVKGRSQPVTLYELLAKINEPTEKSKKYIQIEKQYKSGLSAYRSGDFSNAISHFADCLKLDAEDKPSKLLLERSKELLSNPPENWIGVWSMTDK